MVKNKASKITMAAMCIAIGVVLPMAIHFIPSGGSILLPMHIPILICGLVCGWKCGVIAGVLTPTISSILTGMPPTGYLPVMICELAVYGLVTGLLVNKINTRNKYVNLYASLIIAMLIGRITMGILNALVFQVANYSIGIWLTAAFITSLPGIMIQLLLIPSIVVILQKAKVISMENLL